jgi:hypothetical protein
MTNSFSSDVAQALRQDGRPFQHKELIGQYTTPPRLALWIPDFVLHNGIVVECKGYWRPEDITKIRLVREQFPDLDVRFVFSSSQQKDKRSRATYASICKKLGIPCNDLTVPREWLDEPDDANRWRAIHRFTTVGRSNGRASDTLTGQE